MNSLLRWLAPLAVCGIAASAHGQERVGPSFDCTSVAAQKQPLAQAVCSDRTLSRNELSYVMAYQAIRQILQTDKERQSLTEAANAFTSRIADACGLPREGRMVRAPSQQTLDCLGNLFLGERDALVARLSGPARVEAELSPQDAIAIQHTLRQLGYLPSNAATDGVYGPATRSAILAWQRAVGVNPTSFASKEMLSRSNRETTQQGTANAVPSQSPIPQAVPVPSASQSTKFGDCRQADAITQVYTKQSFLRNDAILNVLPSEWTTSTLEQALQWARSCFDAARARGDVVPPRTAIERQLSHFAANAAEGMAQRKAREDAPRLAHEAARTFLQQMNETVPLSGGGTVSCMALGNVRGLPANLDDLLFGQKLRSFAVEDYPVIERKLAQCDAIKPLARAQELDRALQGVQVPYYPERLDVRELPRHIDELRRKETYEMEMRDPAKRAQAEFREKERRFGAQEAQIRGGLDGKPTRQPPANASEQVIYCGGYFTLQRSIDALVRADITPSADDSAMRALGFQTLAQTWLVNRQGVLGTEAVERELVPVFYAGLTAGLSADIETTKRLYRSCTAAAEALGRERAKLK